MVPQWIIEKKRDGHALTEEDIRSFIQGFANEDIPDYQMAALAMAVYFQGMTFDEVSVLTDAMMRSGATVDTSSVPFPKVDKHSTGGIGDKVSLVLAPLVACCDIAVPMISGRGLGITGGTLDKMESIPGYRTDLSCAEFVEVIAKCGCSIIGQTAELAPADRKLYALRDVTGTVPSIPLISASIMSKKLAEGIDALVLDVKCGSGAFMKSPDRAHELARTMMEIGKRMNKGMAAVITDMNQPLGRTAGNAVEVVESLETLRGNGPADLMEVTLTLASHMLVLAGRSTDLEEASDILQAHIDSGRALEKFREMVRLHGGSTEALDDTSLLPCAGLHVDYPAPLRGHVTKADAELIGRACIVLGAGRTSVDETVDHAAGITGIVKIGERADKGHPLLTMHANSRERIDEAVLLLEKAFEVSDENPECPPLIIETITGEAI
jgi:pyrimidine-nucleoside phosphorylase